MNSKKFADKILRFLKIYITYDHKKELLVHYGLETLYILITKIIIITIASLILGITKEMLIFIMLYGLLRLYASGLHLKTSFDCTIFSLIVMLGFPILAMYTNIIMELRIIIAGGAVSLFALYSPADTIRKPMIHTERRILCKIKSITICLIYLFLIFTIKEQFLLNCITYSLILESFLITPISYKLFNQPYNNYLNYKAD